MSPKKVQIAVKQDKPNIPPLTIEKAKLIWKNFSGSAKKFNAAGLRNFHVVLDPPVAKQLEKDGWNVKWQPAREEGDPDLPTLKVAVRFDNYPPRIVLLSKGGRTTLDEDSVEVLDYAEIDNIDMILSPYYWERDGKSGIKAYLKKMFVTLSESDLEAKYNRIDVSAKHDLEDED
jgi:hypothetical protein